MASLKRKFQKVNQELVRQNAALQDQLNRQRQEQNAVLQESVRLKSKIVALEARLQDGHDAVMELKRSIGERVEMLEAIGQHVLDLGKFLNVISRQDTAQQDQAHGDVDDGVILEEMNQLNRQQVRKLSKCAADLTAIREEEGQAPDLLAQDICNVSLKGKRAPRREPQ